MLSNRVKCQSCKHYHIHPEGNYPICDAFPEQIPLEIFNETVDHEKPYRGDGGIMYEPKEIN